MRHLAGDRALPHAWCKSKNAAVGRHAPLSKRKRLHGAWIQCAISQRRS